MAQKQKVSKYHAAPLKDFVQRIGCGHLIQKMDKNKCFWPDMHEPFFAFHYKLKDYSIGLDIRRELRDMISVELSTRSVELSFLDEKISLWDYWVYSSNIRKALIQNFKKDSKSHLDLRSILDKMDKCFNEVIDKFDHSFSARLMTLLSPENFVYSYTWKAEKRDKLPRYVITLNREKTERRDIIMAGKSRKISRPEIYWEK